MRYSASDLGFLVCRWSGTADFEMLSEQHEGRGSQSKPAEDAKAIHKSQERSLRRKLLIYAQRCRSKGVGVRIPVDLEIPCERIDAASHRRRRCRQVTADHRLMEVLAALTHGGDERDSEASTPIPAKICERGRAVVLVGPQLRICDHRERDEEEGVAKTLQSTGPRVVAVVGLQREIAIVQERQADDDQRSEQQHPGMNNATLNELGSDWRKNRDDEGTRPEDEARIDCTVAVKRLQYLRNHRRRREQPEPKHEVEGTGDGKIARFDQTEVDDRIWMA